MHMSRPAVVSTVIVGVLLTKFAHSQVKTDSLPPLPKGTIAQARDTASVKKDTLQAAPVSPQDTSEAAAQAGTGPDPKQDALKITIDSNLMTLTCPAPDGKMITRMLVNIESQLATIGFKPGKSMDIDEKHVVIKNGKIYVLFDGCGQALTIKPKSSKEGGDADFGVAPAPKK